MNMISGNALHFRSCNTCKHLERTTYCCYHQHWKWYTIVIQRVVLIINDNGDDAFSTPFKSLIDENLWSWLCFLKCYDLGFCSDPSPPLCLHVFTRYFIERDFKTKGFIKTKAPAGHSWWKYKTKRKEVRTPLKTEKRVTIICKDFFFCNKTKDIKAFYCSKQHPLAWP